MPVQSGAQASRTARAADIGVQTGREIETAQLADRDLFWGAKCAEQNIETASSREAAAGM